MNDILYRAAAYLLIIALGVFLKKVGFFHEQDFRTLAKILLNITLPCAIIYSFSKVDFQISLLTVTVLSLFVGINCTGKLIIFSQSICISRAGAGNRA